jgi:hypothetical protein
MEKEKIISKASSLLEARPRVLPPTIPMSMHYITLGIINDLRYDYIGSGNQAKTSEN